MNHEQKMIEAVRESAYIRNCHACGSEFGGRVFLTDNYINYCFHICINCWRIQEPAAPTTYVVVGDAGALRDEINSHATAAQLHSMYDPTQSMH